MLIVHRDTPVIRQQLIHQLITGESRHSYREDLTLLIRPRYSISKSEEFPKLLLIHIYLQTMHEVNFGQCVLSWDGYQCGICGSEFKTQQELTQHQMSQHPTHRPFCSSRVWKVDDNRYSSLNIGYRVYRWPKLWYLTLHNTIKYVQVLNLNIKTWWNCDSIKPKNWYKCLWLNHIFIFISYCIWN